MYWKHCVRFSHSLISMRNSYDCALTSSKGRQSELCLNLPSDRTKNYSKVNSRRVIFYILVELLSEVVWVEINKSVLLKMNKQLKVENWQNTTDWGRCHFTRCFTSNGKGIELIGQIPGNHISSNHIYEKKLKVTAGRKSESSSTANEPGVASNIRTVQAINLEMDSQQSTTQS